MQKNSFWLPVVLQVKLYILSIIYLILKHVEIALHDFVVSVWDGIFSGSSAKKVKSKATKLILWWVRLPFKIMYYIYIYPFVFAVQTYLQFISWSIHLVLEQKGKLNQLTDKLHTTQAQVEKIVVQVLSSKLSEFVPFIINVILEMFISMFWPSQKSDDNLDHSHSLDDLSELLAYEEYEEDENLSQNALNTQNTYGQKNTHLLMHCYVPTNPFKATVRRVRKSASKSSTSSESQLVLKSNKRDNAAVTLFQPKRAPRVSPTDCMMSTYDFMGADSPASFPSTPFSRAYVMNKSSEKVVSVMFAARDKLRLEAQSVSRDEYSSLVAREAKTSGQFAQFDDVQSSSGIALSCGNHCAVKVGKGLCCGCRSKAPVRTNSYVYLEFSITVSNAQVPNLGIGLAPLETPLNVMVGSWPKSVGLYSDSQLWIGSQSQNLGSEKMAAGSTVGMLVHISELNVDSPIARLRADSKFSSLRSPTIGTRLTPLAEGNNSNYSDSKPVLVGIADLGGGDEKSETSNDMELPAVVSSYECAVEPLPAARPREGSVNELLKNALLSNKDAVADSDIMAPSQSKHNLRLMVPQPKTSVAAQLNLQFNINGKVVSYPKDVKETICEIPSGGVGGTAVTLYPTVSILSEDTRVWCRFCAEDVVYRSRKAIGAPEGVRVYCLDGSLLIKETD